MPKWFVYFLAGGFFFCLFILFSYLVHENVFTQLDFNSTVRLQDNLSRRVDKTFSFFSIFGNFEVMLVLLVGVIGVIKKLWGGICAIFLFGAFHVIEIFGKVMVEHPPPPQFLLRTNHGVDFPQFHVRSEFSYPSGHSGRTIFISVLLLFLIYRSNLSALMKLVLFGAVLVFDSIMLVSRVYLGEHWLTDVVGGALLGFALGVISLSAFSYNFSFRKSLHHATKKG